MHTYLFNLEKGGLHEVLDPRELDNTDENARAITLMCFEEFKADKTIPYNIIAMKNPSFNIVSHLSLCADTRLQR